MKLFLMCLVFFNFSNTAFAVEPDRKVTCKVSNGWTISTDYYWDGHPQGPGGWSGVSQINDWGKFTVDVDEITNFETLEWVTIGHTGGPTRLESLQIEYSLNKKKEGYFNVESTDVMGGVHLSKYTLKCE